jgi:hypothetical protein
MVYVFKTTVKTKEEILELKPHLDDLFEQTQWNFDLEDCDKILRIESQTEIAEITINLLKISGYFCEELL